MKTTEQKASYTPGAWRWSTIGLHEPERNTLLAGECEVARVEFRSLKGCDEANARLIAAAPDLLEACERAIERLNAANRARTEKQGHFRNGDIEAAIAKAKGQ